MITLLLLAMVTTELAILSIILTRGLGDEGILVSQHIAARRAADIALNRLADRLNDVASTPSPDTLGQLDALFAKNGRWAVRGELLTLTRPDSGKTEPSGITLYGWIEERRGNFCHLVGQARMGRISLTAHRWVKVSPPALIPPEGFGGTPTGALRETPSNPGKTG